MDTNTQTPAAAPANPVAGSAKQSNFVGGVAQNIASILVNLMDAGVVKKSLFDGHPILRTFKSTLTDNGGTLLSIERSIDYAKLKEMAKGGKPNVSKEMWDKINAILVSMDGYDVTDPTVISEKLNITEWDGQYGQTMLSIYPKRESRKATVSIGGKPAEVKTDIQPEEAKAEAAHSLEVEDGNPFADEAK